ncbi:MAG: hypothetical protein IIZ68_02970, partial [Clostridia bacterium]|nr:hypothetical protein [Clostridia bacterium]
MDHFKFAHDIILLSEQFRQSTEFARTVGENAISTCLTCISLNEKEQSSDIPQYRPMPLLRESV